ncbi:MAG: phosphotransferase [Sarcina sp.]
MYLESTVREAVILAAGHRKEFSKPVGLLEIEDCTIIDRQIKMLKECGIEKIFIITGYEAEDFEVISRNNIEVELINNEYYKWTGNMASLALVEDKVKGDFLIIENDLVFDSTALESMLSSEYEDCVLITSESGSGDEAFVEIKNDCVYKISKDIHQFNKIDGEMIGVSKITQDFFDAMLEEFSMNVNPYVNYEYIMLDVAREKKLFANKVEDLVWGEVDNKAQYELLIKNIMPRLRRKEMACKIEEVKNVVVDATNIDKETIKSVSPIGGMTNSNYKVRAKKNEYIVRIPGVGTSAMLNRINEARNSALVATLDIDANIIYYDEQTGTKVSEMIKGAQTINGAMAKMPDTMKNISAILRKLHNSKIAMENEFDVFENIELYESILDKYSERRYEGYEQLREKIFALKNILIQYGRCLKPCHCDTVPENFIKDDEGKYYLIDWEYSGLNDPMWDLAAHSIECDFSDEEEELFLKLYFENKEYKEEYVRVQIYKLCQDFLWSIWTRIKEEQGENFGSYGLDRYNRCLANIDKFI